MAVPKGTRIGGRAVGTKDLRIVEQELQAGMDAERTVSEARATGRKLAKEVLADFMQTFMGIAVKYQPLSKDGAANPDYDEGKFERWAMNACTMAKWLAPYQSPTFRQVTLTNPQPDRTQHQPHATKAVAAILDLMAEALRAPAPRDITSAAAARRDIIEGELVEVSPTNGKGES